MTQVITRVPKATKDEMESAVEAAKAAYKTWSKTSILTRQQVMFKYQHIIRNNMVLFLGISSQDSITISWFCRKPLLKALLKSKEKQLLMLKEMSSEASVSQLYQCCMWYIFSITY